MNNVGTYFYNDDLVLLWQTRELNNEFYYIYMESNIAGVSLVTIYHLNK